MIIYTCPECGADLLDIMIATYPPIASKFCQKCGWAWEEPRSDDIRVPFSPAYIPPSCRNCCNHPSNGGSGVCCCTLGSPAIT